MLPETGKVGLAKDFVFSVGAMAEFLPVLPQHHMHPGAVMKYVKEGTVTSTVPEQLSISATCTVLGQVVSKLGFVTLQEFYKTQNELNKTFFLTTTETFCL